MNPKYITIFAVIAATILGTTVITADCAFAYEKSQATAQKNYCGNGELPENVGCQNTASQIQGDGNEAVLASEQASKNQNYYTIGSEPIISIAISYNPLRY